MSHISYEEACARIAANVESISDTEIVSLQDVLNRAAAADLFATIPNPRFDNSAVDGYALGQPAKLNETLKTAFTVKAGETPQAHIPPACATRVFTGAMLPGNTFAVVMQEHVSVSSDTIVLQEEPVRGQGIRKCGADFPAGKKLLSRGESYSPGALALAASQGISELDCYVKVPTAIIASGDELVTGGGELKGAAIYDSNTPMLRAQCVRSGADGSTIKHVADSLSEMRLAIESLANSSRVLLISGGASVGDYDFVHKCMRELGEIVFHGVNIKPGRPFLFGKIGQCAVFGLPGNPASAFVCFEIFVRDAIRILGGYSKPALCWLPVRYMANHAAHGREEFVRARLTGSAEAHPAGDQGSFGIESLISPDVLVRLPAERSIESGEFVQALLL